MTETPTHTPLPEPRPCPFCGGTSLALTQPCSGGDYGVLCRGCHTTQDTRGTEAEALTAWNTRADSHHDLIEALKAFARVTILPDGTAVGLERHWFERARDLLAALKEAGRG